MSHLLLLRRRAFTLVEMLVVMVVIAILTGIVLALAGPVNAQAARKRVQGEIQALATGCENYKADNGSYPQDASTDTLDPRSSGNPAAYQASSLFLYKQLSGDLDANGRNEPNASTPEPKSYLQDFWKPRVLAVDSSISAGTAGYVKFIQDPYGSSYGYSTKGAAAEQAYRTAVLSNPAAVRTTGQGYNPTFDLWSTAGKTTPPTPGTAADITNVWIKNW